MTPVYGATPQYETLLDGRGLINHTFVDLRFVHAGWFGPGGAGGYIPIQSGVVPTTDKHSVLEPRGAAHLSNTAGIKFVDCTFEAMGSAYALSVGNASRNMIIRGCDFVDLSGGAVMLGNVGDEDRAISPDPSQWDVRPHSGGLCCTRCSVGVQRHGGRVCGLCP